MTAPQTAVTHLSVTLYLVFSFIAEAYFCFPVSNTWPERGSGILNREGGGGLYIYFLE